MFEVMVEGQLKHVTPDDRIYIGLESNSKVELSGFWANATATVVMKLVCSWHVIMFQYPVV